MVKGAVKGLTFDVLLDACSTGPEGYIARQNQLKDDKLKLARRQIEKETNFPINSYVLAEYETKKPDKGYNNTVQRCQPAKIKIDLHAVLLITLDNWVTQHLSILWILPLFTCGSASSSLSLIWLSVIISTTTTLLLARYITNYGN